MIFNHVDTLLLVDTESVIVVKHGKKIHDTEGLTLRGQDEKIR